METQNKKIIMINDETKQTIIAEYVTETPLAIATKINQETIWLPKSQLHSQNMMYLTPEQKEVLDKNELTVHNSYIITVSNWIWTVKKLNQ